MSICTKKVVTIFIVLVLIIALIPIQKAEAKTIVYPEALRILLTTDATSLSLKLTGKHYLLGNEDFDLSAGSATIGVSGSKVKLTRGDNTYTSSKITIKNGDYWGTSSTVSLKHANKGTLAYLGDLVITVSSGKLRIVNHILGEQYLYGVVSHEMSNSNPVEALKAQAVCARGYAIAAAQSRSKYDYDIVDSSSDQTYYGYEKDVSRVISAVDGTRGQVLTYGGSIIQSYYAASNGGQTEKSGNVWSTNYPYYVNKDDPYDLAHPSSRQELSFIPKEFSEANKKLMDSAVLDMITAGANKAAGTKIDIKSVISVTPNTPLYPAPSRCFTKADIVVSDGEKEYKVTIKLDDLITIGVFGNKGTLRMRGAEPATKNGVEGWNLTNRRWGHGVGMSQRGAQQRATEGQDYKTILAFYFDGTTLTTLSVPEKPEIDIPDVPVNPDVEEALDYEVGDINKDGFIDIFDILMIQKHILGIEELTGDSFTYADIDKNNDVDIFDILAMQKHILGIEIIPAKTEVKAEAVKMAAPPAMEVQTEEKTEDEGL